MSFATLSISIALSAATGAFLAYAGHLNWHRPSSGPERQAILLFAIAWFAGAGLVWNDGLRLLLGTFGLVDDALFTALGYLSHVTLAIALWGLMYYILYLLTGRARLLAPLTVAYFAYLGFLFWYESRFGSHHYELGEWGVKLVPGNPSPPWLDALFGGLMAGPILLVVGTYASLAVRVREPTQRYRLSMVSGAFLFLFGVVLTAYVIGLNEADWFGVLYQGAALLAAVCVVLAYRPPRWVVRRYGVTPVIRRGNPADK